MKTRNKVLLLLACAVVLVVGSIAGTYAYLTSQTFEVRNTFTVGNVSISLDESDTDENGNILPDASPVLANEYKLIPGHEYTKDPTIHIASSSEACYVFVEVKNDIINIEDNSNTIASQMATNNWVEITTCPDVYYYGNNEGMTKVSYADQKDLPIFESFKISTDADLSSIGESTTITITAYAIQAEGIEVTDIINTWNKLKPTNP